MLSVEKKILTNVTKRGRGKIIFPQDLASYGTPDAVHKAFGRLVASEWLLRVAQVVYCYPKIGKVLGLGILYPTTFRTQDIQSFIPKYVARVPYRKYMAARDMIS